MKKLLTIILTLGIVYGCSEGFTEIDPKGSLNAGLLSNEEGVDLLLAGAYAMLTGQRDGQSADWHGAGDNWWFDAIADEAHKGSTNGDQGDLFLLEIFDWAANNPYPNGKWESLFAGVNRANAVINQANNVTGADLSAKIAEARFLRGHYNFELQRIWQIVPYISEDDIADPNLPNEGAIYTQIEDDFNFAIGNLPPTQGDAGRATSWAAKAYLGKVLLYQGKFGPALTQFNDVINNGPYDLNPEYGENFTAAGKNGVESIFAIQFANDGGQSFSGNRGGTLNFAGGGPYNSCCGFYQPTQDLVNAFQTNGGLPLLDTWNQTDVANDQDIPSADAFTLHTGPLDPRLDYTVGRRGIDYNGFGPHAGFDWVRAQFDAGPYLPTKNTYRASELDAAQGTGAWGQQRAGINYNLLRFADVLIMAAEAEAEVGTLANALAHINRVRQRAISSTTIKDASGADAANYQISLYGGFPDKTFAVKAIRFERRLELAMEGHRYFDLVRWGVAESVMNAYFPNETRTITSFAPRPFLPKHNVFPIPLNAIDLSNGILTQNPLWASGG
ncbi:MAG: RagB/SusD family nutrient uptake outer membrane protein [Bacteroidetes bacterium]|nr:RagB/SusD family nutrient uptake outer membrane protein [Bacteroidota bacterium]